MKTKIKHLFIITVLLVNICGASAQTTSFTYQGELNNGSAPANGSYDLRFSLYDAATNGDQLAALINTAVKVSNGLFTTAVDFGNAFNGSNYWLDIAVSTNGANNFKEMNPRQLITPVPSALFASSLPNGVGGSGNSVTGIYSVVGGGSGNVASGYSGVTVGGGIGNTATGGEGTTISGGLNNTAIWQWATVGGGYYNNASNGLATTVSGGAYNTAGSYYATVCGGYENIANGYGSFVGGGGVDENNNSGGNRASGGASVIGGGVSNTNIGDWATIGGGGYNTASGWAATVPGGYQNIAKGQFSFAAGRQAQATDTGAFVWSDSTGTALGDRGNNSVTIRASGGYWFYSNSGATAGVFLNAGSTAWATYSDKNLKKDFKAVDTVSVLNKLAAIPVEQWHYKWEQGSDTLNIGPMAQDFKHAFYPGRDDKSITTLEFDGVELAAIQGLNQRLNQKDKELQDLKQQNDSIEAKLRELEQAINLLTKNK
jgi:hypothetical protein